MKHQWLRIGSFVLAAAALPFLLSAAITTNPDNHATRSVGSQTGNVIGFDKLVSPFAAYAMLVNPVAVSDNDTDNLAQIQDSIKNPSQLNSLINLRNQGLSFRAENDGRLRHLAVGAKPLALSKKVSDAANVAKQFLIDYGKLFGLTNVNQLAKPTISRDSVGYTHLRYQYIYKNVPVWGGEMLVQLDKNNAIAAATGKIISGINLNTKPAYSAAKIKTAAIKIGQAQFKMKAPLVGGLKLYVYNRQYWDKKNASKFYLAYKVDLSDDSTVQAKILMLNANTGQLLDQFEGQVNSLDRQIYNCNGYEAGPKCYTNHPPEGFDAGRLEGEPMVPERMVNWAYDAVDKAYDYWQTNFMLDGANNQGGVNKSKTPIKTNAAYANGSGYWQKGANSHIGLKSTVSQETQTRTLYHEYTHAVYEFQGPVVTNYEQEDGSLDEAYASIFEIATAQAMDDSGYDWDLGWNNLQNPRSVDGNAAPLSHYDSNFICDKRANSLHINGLVIGHLAYLLSNGGKLEDCNITPVGFDAVQQILYFAMKRLPDLPDFNDFYDAVNDACNSAWTADTCEEIRYAMQVAQLDNLGICNDPAENDKTKREDLCDDKGDPIKQTDPNALCAKYGYNCGKPTVFDDATRKYVEVDCDKCPGCSCKGTDTCQNYKCVKCEPWTDQQLCAHYDAECDYLSDITDNCGNKRGENVYGKKLLFCGRCIKPKVCIATSKKSYCGLPKNIKGDGGMYDSSGKPAANGGYYRHVTIGTQTLFKDNFNGGAQINAPAVQTAYQKYCWQNNSSKCMQFGGLYQWHTAMGLPPECDSDDCSNLISPINHRGICPEGFHVPTDGEWSQLEDALKLPDQSCDPDRYNAYDCRNAGAAMRLIGDNDFTAKIFSGIHDKQIINSSHFLSATQLGSFNPMSIWTRGLTLPTYSKQNSSLSDQASGVGRVASGKNYFFALRCFADCELHDGVWSDWKPIGGCGEIKPNIQKQYRSCDNRSCGGQACAGDAVREVPCDPEKTCGGLVKVEGGPRDKYGRDSRALYYNLAAPLPAGFGGGGYYATAQVGEACWLADNLNVGTKVINEKQRASAGGGIEKWCYKNDARYCNLFGGLYSWMEATNVYVDYAKEKKNWYDPPAPYGSEWLKGICPAGWKLPSNGDWQKLLDVAKNSTFAGINFINTPIRLDSGLTDADNTLAWSSQGFIANDMTNISGSIYDESNKYSSNSGDKAMFYGGFGGYSNVLYSYFLSARKGFEGLPVRCVKSCEPVNGQWSDWQKDGDCGQYEAYMQRYTRVCSEPKCGGKTCEGAAGKEERCLEPANCGVVAYEGGPYDADGVTRNQGGYYRTALVQGTNAQGVTIDQCWLRDNLNVGQLVGVADQSNDSITEKYCRYYYDSRSSYEGARAICQEFGGLYQWAEAMKLSAKCLDASSLGICAVNKIHRGICPAGWHIPTDDEWHQLELYYSNAAGNLITCEAERISAQDKNMSDEEWSQTNCAKAGYKLRDNGMSGFDAMTEAFIKVGGGFDSRKHDLYYRKDGRDYRMGGYPILPEDEMTAFWTAKAPTQFTDLGGGKKQFDNSQAINRFLIGNYNNGIYRNLRSKRDGLSVRCIKDPCIVIDPKDPNYLVTTHAGQGGVGFGTYNPSGLPYCQPESQTTTGPTVNQPTTTTSPPAPTIPGTDGAQLSLSEQVDYLKKIVSQASLGRPYTGDQLLFISSPQVYLSEYGFTEAQRRLSVSGGVAN